ncbi:MAG: hypothetical protein WBW48_16850 [Anaerolineae bacterium]
MTIEEDAGIVLQALEDAPRDSLGRAFMNGHQIQAATDLEPAQINDAIAILEEAGLITLHNWMGTAPYLFGEAALTSRGRYELERARLVQEDHVEAAPTISRPPLPVGSPYGFTDEDWEYVAERRSLSDVISVVMGYQFESEHYETATLVENIRASFEDAVDKYRDSPGARDVMLDFRQLAAGYGEHLFNEIARDIITADIAVFETSDLNPNVMVELGVALTWGIRVLPIKLVGRPKPPSDISGQTWADYRDSGAQFVDSQHMRKLVRMVERAARKKARNQ